MNFKENILKSVTINLILVSIFTIFGFGQSLEFTYPDSIYNYTEEDASNHLIHFSDNNIFNGNNFSFEFSGEDTTWLNVASNIFGANGAFWINFYGTPDDENMDDTLFTLVVTNDLTVESDTLDFVIEILEINDKPEITGHNPLFYLKNSQFQIVVEDLIIEDPDNEIEDFRITTFSGDNYIVENDSIIVNQNFLGELLVEIQLNDSELENNLSDTFTVFIDIVTPPQIISTSNEIIEVAEDEFYSFTVNFIDEDSPFLQQFYAELLGNASNWLTVNNFFFEDNSFGLNITGNPDDVNLSDSSLTIIILDNFGLSDTIDYQFQINPTNDAPIIIGQYPLISDEEDSFQISLSDLIIDHPINEENEFELSVLDGEFFISDSLNTIYPDTNFFGNLNIQVQVSDGDSINSLSNIFDLQVQINPINDPPVFNQLEIDTLYAIEESELYFEIKFLDPDETSTFDFIVTENEGSQWYNQNIDISKNGDEYTIGFTGTPDDVDLDETNIMIEVTDEFGLTDLQNINIQIESVNDLNPVFLTSFTEQVINEDEVFIINIEFEDADNHPIEKLMIEISGPATNWINLNNDFTLQNEIYQFSVSGTPDDFNYDDDFIILKITDYDSASIEDTINLHILSTNDAPVENFTTDYELNAAFGATNYSTIITFHDIDNHDISDYQIDINNIMLNGNSQENYLELGDLQFYDDSYHFSVSGVFEENISLNLCEFDISVTDEVFFMNEEIVNELNESTVITVHYSLPILANSAPVPVISVSENSGFSGSEIVLTSNLSFDLNDDIHSYYWSVKPVVRNESFIDLNNNGLFDNNEPFHDLNNNDNFDPLYEEYINSEIIDFLTTTAILTIPETFDDTDIIVELIITDSKGASGSSQATVRSVNPKLVLDNDVIGNQGEIATVPFHFENLLNEPIYSLDIEFSWNIQEFELDNEFSCSSMSYYPPVIGDSISLTISDLSQDFQYNINDLIPGKLGFTVYSTSGDSLNSIINSNISFAELNIPLTGFHNESDRIYVSKCDINEKKYGYNSNLDSLNGNIIISGNKIQPLAGFVVRDIDGEEITESDFIYSGSKLEFEVITVCDGENSPIENCESTGHNLLGNGLQPQYSWDFDSDGIIDESGMLYSNILNNFTYSITGFENITKTATLNIETAYGCASNQFNIDIEPLIPTIRMTRSGDGFDYDGEPASINLFINQMEDLEALDLVINYDPSFISIIDVESQINNSTLLLHGSHYSLLHNNIYGQVNITAYSDSLENYTFFNETSDFQFASLKFYALQPGNTDISITSFNVNEASFLSNIGENILLTIENVNPNDGQYDCDLNGEYDEGEEFTDENENGIYDIGEYFTDLGILNGSAIIDQCGICSGGQTNNIPNSTQDCQGTCMPFQLLEIIDVEMVINSIFVNGEIYSLLCEDSNEGFNIENLECGLYIGLESSHPLANDNGVDLCGLCGGNNIELDGQFIGSEIDCNGYCSDNTPNGSDQYGFCGCSDDGEGLYPDIYGYCKNGEEPILGTGLCADIFEDVNMDGEWTELYDSIIQKIDTTTAEFSKWGYKYLNFDPVALNDDGSCSRGVIINEFFFSPVQGTAVPDYIELLNMTPFNLDISSWHVNEIDISENYTGPTPIMPAGKHFLISTGLPFYNLEGEMYFPDNSDNCDGVTDNCYYIPNSMALNINLGMNNGEILIVDYTIMDYLNYSDEAYWPVGAPFIGHAVELIEPYKSRNLSSNWLRASEHYPNPYMATEDGEWDVAGGYNYGTPGRSNDAYNINHPQNCDENSNNECNLTKYDCDDVFNGLAFYDLCGICAGGSTNNLPNIFDEELGMCTGNEDIIDCACTCFIDLNFGAIVDDCGQCTLGNAGSFDSSGDIVVEQTTTLICENDDDCDIWGMVCSPYTSSVSYCHHEFEGQKDDCGTCRSGPECSGVNDDTCDEYYNLYEDYTDENQNWIYDEGEEFIDINSDGVWNDGIDDCGVCTQFANDVYSDSNGDEIISPCFDGEFDEYGNWISNCLDWFSASDVIGCPVDCMGDVNNDGMSDDLVADLDDCDECIICDTNDCSEVDIWNSSCVYDFNVTTDMNIPGIQLDWTPLLEFDYYQIYRDSVLFVDSLLITESSLIDDDVSYPESYCYYITAFNELGEYSNPSLERCSSIDYYGHILFEDFQFNAGLNSVSVNFDVSDELDTILIHIAENVTVDSLKNGLFDDDWYIVEQNNNNIKIYLDNPNSTLIGFMEMGDIYFTRDTTGLDDSFCIDNVMFNPLNEVFFQDGLIVQSPDCEYFGCTDSVAFNFDENATINDGSCHFSNYVLNIGSTGYWQSITFSPLIDVLESGDEIGIFDENAIVSTECPAQYDELLVGSGLFNGEEITINAIRAVPCSPINPQNPASLGFIPGNDIIVKVWQNATQMEMTYSISEQGHFFSGSDIIVEQLNIPLHYEIEIEETGNFQSITFGENISGLEYGDHIGIFDYSGISSTNCPAQYDTVLVGSGYYTNEELTIDAIRATPCSPFNPNAPAESGFVVGNQVIIKIWRDGYEPMEYLMGTQDPQPIFGIQGIAIDELLSNNIVLIPNQYHLHPVFPNPFNPIATIRYDIPEIANINIEVFNVLGKRIEMLYSGLQNPGIYEIQWNGSGQSSGLYLIRMSSKDVNFTEKVMLVK